MVVEDVEGVGPEARADVDETGRADPRGETGTHEP
jgi:hypothetical protein